MTNHKLIENYLKENNEVLEELGRELYIKIAKGITHEASEITEDDCKNYIKDIVVNRTLEGYKGIQTIYGQLQGILGMPIKPAPDDWDRLYNVDFFIEVNDKYVGIQIKPVTFEHTFENYKWQEMQETTHLKFQKKFSGRVFIVFSVKVGDKKTIKNIDVIDNIKNEIEKLQK